MTDLMINELSKQRQDELIAEAQQVSLARRTHRPQGHRQTTRAVRKNVAALLHHVADRVAGHPAGKEYAS